MEVIFWEYKWIHVQSETSQWEVEPRVNKIITEILLSLPTLSPNYYRLAVRGTHYRAFYNAHFTIRL